MLDTGGHLGDVLRTMGRTGGLFQIKKEEKDQVLMLHHLLGDSCVTLVVPAEDIPYGPPMLSPRKAHHIHSLFGKLLPSAQCPWPGISARAGVHPGPPGPGSL